MIVIILIHDFKKITRVFKNFDDVLTFENETSIQKLIFEFAQQFPEAQLIWVHESLINQVNQNWIENNVSSKIMYFYNPSETEFLSDKVGYVEPSPFIKINKKVCFASWQASTFIGTISAQDFLSFGSRFIKDNFSFGYFLTIISKIGHRNGLRTYSNPNLLQGEKKLVSHIGTTKELFHWTAQYYGFSKCLQLLLLFVLYEKQFPIASLISVISVKRIAFDTTETKQEVLNVAFSAVTLDVLIPTIGRKKYLYDVLCDLRTQTKIPNRIIIVEQNPLENSQSELDYLKNEIWPFEIIHHFIHQTGACNARNIALKEKAIGCFLLMMILN